MRRPQVICRTRRRWRTSRYCTLLRRNADGRPYSLREVATELAGYGPVTLPAPTKAALEAWLQARGAEDGPLFVNFDRAGKGGRLTRSAVYFIVRGLGTKAGLTVRLHGLRHLAITSALDLTKGDVRAVQKFSRHKDVRVLNTYDDNRQDLAGDVARLVAGV